MRASRHCADVLEEPAAPPSRRNVMCRQLVHYLIFNILNDVTANKRVFDAVQTTELTTTNSMEHSPSSEVNPSSSSQEIPRILWNSYDHCLIQKGPLSVPVLTVIPRVPETRLALASPQPYITKIFCTYVRVCFAVSPDILYVCLRTSCLSDDARRKWIQSLGYHCS